MSRMLAQSNGFSPQPWGREKRCGANSRERDEREESRKFLRPPMSLARK